MYVLWLIAVLACTDHSRFQWTAMYGLGGDTTRVSQTDVNLINSFCVQGIIRGSLEPSLILTHQHLKQMFAL